MLSTCCSRRRYIAKASSFNSVADLKTKAHLLAGKMDNWLLELGREA
jgi:hypothetical protein